MTTRERKLLRKQINYKLKCMVNRESKENDFYNSSQILTERQQMYMTISKYFRTQDNRRQPRTLPFNVERASLPHVNLAFISRLYELTNETINSPDINKVLAAHSFRTATPFYTNPGLTIDRGKVMNYTAHVGAVLHTPRYIDFLKNTPEYASSAKTQQSTGSEKHRRSSSPSYSYNSTTILSLETDSSSTKNKSGSKHSAISSRSSSPSSAKSNPPRSRSNTITSASHVTTSRKLSKVSVKSSSSNLSKIKAEPNTNSDDLNFKFENEISDQRRQSTDSRSKLTEAAEERKVESSQSSTHSSKVHLERQYGFIEVRSGSMSSTPKDSSRDNTPEPKIILERQNGNIEDNLVRSGSVSSTPKDSSRDNTPEPKIILERQNGVIEDNLVRSGSVSSTPKDSSRDNTPEPISGLLIRNCENFFINRKLEKEDFDVIIRYFDTVTKYRVKNPDYVSEFGSFLTKNNSQHFKEFQELLLDYKLKNIKDDEAKDVQDLIEKFSLDLFFANEPKYVTEMQVEYTNGAEISKEQGKTHEEEGKPEESFNETFTFQESSLPNRKLSSDSFLHALEHLNEMDESSFEKVTEETVSDQEEEKTEGKDVLNPEKRMNPIEANLENFEINNETEYNHDSEENEWENTEDFTEAFKILFRNSITVLKKDDLENLKKLVNQYESEKETVPEKSDFYDKFCELFTVTKDQMTEADLEELLKLGTSDFEIDCEGKNGQFQSFLNQYNGRTIEDLEMENVQKLIRIEQESRKRRISEADIYDDDEENDTMMAFRNLFRSSVGEIKKSDLEQIQKIISEHK